MLEPVLLHGNYYAWGEITTKSSYTEENSLTYGKEMPNIAGDTLYDVASAVWGGSWRLPTRSDFLELRYECQWEWTTLDGHKGYEITGPNGNSIFLPAAGYYHGTHNVGHDWDGIYWTSTPCDDTEDACEFGFINGVLNGIVGIDRFIGHSVHPVME